ncbi:serine/threonine protein kinase [Geodermatophilus pulveris]|uniref:non-specific serine/threonine protein kinase n=1 Tax=Geodermatophilus pulveris TaxID=1564159 RepID=A0A239DYZ9_9ACTN|nr:serine/threonine-protein kinase [Geodermatophilus pulveris]SNS37715.1 serine/threonine protein kinase [Geodermatophilus pulveris]
MTDGGRALGSRYLLHTCIGRGAAGEVWSATSRDTDRPLAAKLLRPEFATDPEVRMRFEHEASRQATLDHPGIVRVRDVVREGAVLALVMDRVDGPDLRAHLAEQRTLSPGTACRIVGQVAAAAAAAHAAGIVHRDLKPENVLLERDGRGTNARIVDFGVSRALTGPALTRASQVPGTPAYLAPELLAGRPAGTAADVYALGVLLAEVLVGRRPTPDERTLLGARRGRLVGPYAAVPEPAGRLLLDCLASAPQQRPSAAQLAARLAHAAEELDGLPALPPAASPDIAAILAESTSGRTAGARRRGRSAVVSGAGWTRLRMYGTWVGVAALAFVLLAASLAAPTLLDRSAQDVGKQARPGLAPGTEEAPETAEPVSAAPDGGLAVPSPSSPETDRPGGTPTTPEEGPPVRPGGDEDAGPSEDGPGGVVRESSPPPLISSGTTAPTGPGGGGAGGAAGSSAPGSTARAPDPPPATAPASPVCPGPGCEGQSPYGPARCHEGHENLIDPVEIRASNGDLIGSLQLVGSARCGTRWAKIATADHADRRMTVTLDPGAGEELRNEGVDDFLYTRMTSDGPGICSSIRGSITTRDGSHTWWTEVHSDC